MKNFERALNYGESKRIVSNAQQGNFVGPLPLFLLIVATCRYSCATLIHPVWLRCSLQLADL